MTEIQNNIAALIDHTNLKPEATRAQIETLCQEALTYRFASVCVNPTHVRLAAEQLANSTVAVCTVVGFPLGANTSTTKAFETEQAIADGATEIDMVINIGALKNGDTKLVKQDIGAVVAVCQQKKVKSKVIIETALLTKEEKIEACQLAVQAGANFVKTSTGFSSGGATASDVALMRNTVGPKIGVKASGGIRSLDDAKKMIDAGANRLGMSAGVKIMKEAATL